MLPMEKINVKDLLSYEEKPIAILDHQVRKLRSKEIASVKVLWKNHKAKKTTWESKNYMRMRYLPLFETMHNDIEGTNLTLLFFFLCSACKSCFCIPSHRSGMNDPKGG